MVAQPAPLVDVSTLQPAVESLRADLDTNLDARVLDSKAPSAESTEDNVLAALFSTDAVPPPPPLGNAKRRRGRNEDRELEVARIDSIVDKEATQLRSIKLVVGASNSRVVQAEKSTTDGAVIVERGTTERVFFGEDTA